MENKIAKNRKSPKDEPQLAAVYKQLNKSASKLNDGLDIAAVTAKDGTKGFGLLPEKFNRSKDNNFHRVKDFIPDSELKKAIKAKK